MNVRTCCLRLRYVSALSFSFCAAALRCAALTNYVWWGSAMPTPPYTGSLEFAAHNIQDAVDVATDGDLVLVMAGTYSNGSAITPGWALENRVMIDKAITVRSLSGLEGTFIVGAPDPITGGCGTNPVRCAYITNGAILAGFTLSNGYTRTFGELTADMSAGGFLLAFGGVISNCVVTGNKAYAYGGGGACSPDGDVLHCVIMDNSAEIHGGGLFVMYGGTMVGSQVHNNYSAFDGGGVVLQGGLTDIEVSDCQVSANTAGGRGGGIYSFSGGTMHGCIVYDNIASNGGGIQCDAGSTVMFCNIFGNFSSHNGGGVCCDAGGVIISCDINNNVALDGGGGVKFCSDGFVANCIIGNNTAWGGGGADCGGGGTLRNCLIPYNSADFGGGVYCFQGGSLQNCTISSNNAYVNGGGVFYNNGGTSESSIIYFNSASNYFIQGSGECFDRCCTTPYPGAGSVVTADPKFLSLSNGNFHIASDSPCRDNGTNMGWEVGAVDLDGNDRVVNVIVDIGCYEIGRLVCSFFADVTCGMAPLPVHFTSYVTGTNTTNPMYLWDFNNDGSNELEGYGITAPTNVYDAGLYSVRLAVANSGDTGTQVRVDYIDVIPEPIECALCIGMIFLTLRGQRGRMH